MTTTVGGGRYRPVPVGLAVPDGDRRRVTGWVGAAGSVAVACYVTLVVVLMGSTETGTWTAFVLAPVLFVVTAPVLGRMLERVEPDRWVRRAVVAGLAAKLVGAFVRFGVNEFVLGHADAASYYLHGSLLAGEFRHLVFSGPVVEASLPDVTGTRFIRLVTGLVYVVTGPSHLGGYVVFSFGSFWGLYCFYRAWCVAVPDGMRRRYVGLLFFLPSTVFWPSSIGKEAWMTTMLGLGSYGVARLLTRRRYGWLVVAVAAAGMSVVRPHVGALFAAGLAAGMVLRRPTGAGGGARKLVGLVVVAVLAGLVMTQVRSYFGLESGLDAREVFDETTRRSSQGGSEFAAVQPLSPTGLPLAVVTVLFRPFLFEAGSPAALLSALEGTVLAGLFLTGAGRLVRLPAMVRDRPYLGFVVVYSLLFVVAFSTISNFGILARQRTQLFPLVIAVVATPAPVRSRRDQHDGPGADDVVDLLRHVDDRLARRAPVPAPRPAAPTPDIPGDTHL